MFKNRYTLFKLLGFEVRVDLSWVILAFIVTWTLAEGLFPRYQEDLPRHVYWLMGIAGAAGLFASIVFHELCHSLVARRYGMPMRGITLFIFGGVAEMESEPPGPTAELMMALAGPASSIFLSGALFGLSAGARAADFPATVVSVLSYTALINAILAGFNLVPAFPLDGGRVLRALLWKWKKSLPWATHIASNIGSGFGTVLIILGIFQIFMGSLVGGIWWFLIGMFLREISQSSYRQVIVREMLEGEKVKRFMRPDPVTVPPHISIRDFVENYVYTHHFKMFPVVDEGELEGCITAKQIKNIPREEWDRNTVAEIAQKCDNLNTVDPETDATRALEIMNRNGISRMMVVRDGSLEGVITLKDLLGFLSSKLDLEGDPPGR